MLSLVFLDKAIGSSLNDHFPSCPSRGTPAWSICHRRTSSVGLQNAAVATMGSHLLSRCQAARESHPVTCGKSTKRPPFLCHFGSRPVNGKALYLCSFTLLRSDVSQVGRRIEQHVRSQKVQSLCPTNGLDPLVLLTGTLSCQRKTVALDGIDRRSPLMDCKRHFTRHSFHNLILRLVIVDPQKRLCIFCLTSRDATHSPVRPCLLRGPMREGLRL